MGETDFFLSHDWGKDEIGRGNHERVMAVNDHLKKLGLKTWFDQDKMSGDIVKQMAEGIEKTKVVLVFITKRYAIMYCFYFLVSCMREINVSIC